MLYCEHLISLKFYVYNYNTNDRRFMSKVMFHGTNTCILYSLLYTFQLVNLGTPEGDF